MSMEQYAIHIAPRGGKVDLIVDEIALARTHAQIVRSDYVRSKRAIGLYCNDSSVSGLIFKEDAPVPSGWKRDSYTADGYIATPKARDKTKVAREEVKSLKAELAALPRLAGGEEFTKRIGTGAIIVPNGRGSFSMLSCWYERVGETTFVMTPWHTSSDVTGDNVNGELPKEKTRTAFLPEGCERVGLSVYYKAKEDQRPAEMG